MEPDLLFKCQNCDWIGKTHVDNKCPKCGNNVKVGVFRKAEYLNTINLHPVYVSFLDILGFKELVENNSVEELNKIYRNILLKMNPLIEFPKTNQKSNLREIVINSLFISDSLVLWTTDFNQNSLYQLLGVLSKVFCEAFVLGIPLRGAVYLGELAEWNDLINHTIYGKGLTGAYLHERNQEWAGCVVSDQCINQFEKLSTVGGEYNSLRESLLTDINLLIKYKVPLKSGTVKEYYALNWMSLTEKGLISKEDIINSFSKHNKLCNDWSVQRKIENTSKFFDYIKNKTY